MKLALLVLSQRLLMLQICRAMSAALSDTSDSASDLTAEATVSHTGTVSSQVTVPGGGKGHSLGRASRKQLASLLCAIWQRFYDKFGSAVPGAPVDGELLLELCDALTELAAIEGMATLLRWHSAEDAGESAQAPLRPSALSSGGPGSHESLPALGAKLCLHANTAWLLSAAAQPLRGAAAAAAQSSAWQPAVQQCSAWPAVAAALAAAWAGSTSQPCCLNPLLLHSTTSAASASLQGSSGTSLPARAGTQPGVRAGATAAHSQRAGARQASQGEQRSAAAGSAATLQRLQLSCGLWALAALLQLCAVEPRPEQWGRYTAALNHLQGALHASRQRAQQHSDSSHHSEDASAPAPAHAQPQHPDDAPAAHTGPRQISSSTDGKGVLHAMQCAHAELAALVDTAQQRISAKGSPHGGSTGAAQAFAKGKANILSVLKRLRVHLAWSTGKSGPGCAPRDAGSGATSPHGHSNNTAQHGTGWRSNSDRSAQPKAQGGDRWGRPASPSAYVPPARRFQANDGPDVSSAGSPNARWTSSPAAIAQPRQRSHEGQHGGSMHAAAVLAAQLQPQPIQQQHGSRRSNEHSTSSVELRQVQAQQERQRRAEDPPASNWSSGSSFSGRGSSGARW